MSLWEYANPVKFLGCLNANTAIYCDWGRGLFEHWAGMGVFLHAG